MHHNSYFIDVKIITMGSDPQAELEEIFEMYSGFIKTVAS
jgi:hypothetical protein